MVEEKIKMSKIGKSLNLVVAVLLVTIVSLTACAPPKPPQQFTLRIGSTGVQSCVPYYVMLEQGFDKKYGITFIETKYPSGDDVLANISTGNVTMGTCGSISLFTATESGLVPNKILCAAAITFSDKDHPSIGVLAANSINSWQDLKGQQIATNALNTPNTAAIKGRLLIEGVSDYELSFIPFANMGLAVAGGNVAAAAMNEPYLTQSLLRGDGKFLGWIVGGTPFEKMESSVWIFDTNFYRQQPEAVKAFFRAYLAALKWINDNPDGTKTLLTTKLNVSNEVSQKMNMSRYTLDGHNDPALLESMQKVLVETGLLKTPIPANQLYDETLLNEVLAEKR